MLERAQLQEQHEAGQPSVGVAPVATAVAAKPAAATANRQTLPASAASGDTLQMRSLERSLPVVKRTPFPQRPSTGTMGRTISLLANHFEVVVPSGDVYHYDIAIITPQKTEAKVPEQKKIRSLSTLMNRNIIRLLVEKYRGELNSCLPAFDGRKNLYTRRKLPFEKRIFSVEFTEGDRTQVFQVQVQYAATVNLDALHAVYANQIRVMPQEVIQALDIIMRHGPCMTLTPVGRSMFSPPGPNENNSLGGGHEVWFGYYTSVRPGQWKPMLNVDRSATAFYEAIPVIEFACKLLSNPRQQVRPDQLRQLSPLQIQRLSKELKNLKVKVLHLPYPRKYRVTKVTTESARTLFFVGDNGCRITVADYFRKKYPNFAKYPNLPCIQTGNPGHLVYLPLETCHIVEAQPYRRKLDEDMTREMIKQTAQPPAVRFHNVSRAVKDLVQQSQPYLTEFGIKVSTDPVKLKGRVLEAPSIVMKKETVKPKDGKWELWKQQFYQAKDIREWVLLTINCRIQINDVKNFEQLLINTGRNLGMNIGPCMDVIIVNNRPMKDTLIGIQQQHPNLQLVVVVLGRGASHGDVKYAAEVELSILTQCITELNFTRKCNPALLTNLLQKINAKMGGVNNGLLPDEKPDIFKRPVIIIGADVSHPAPGDKVQPSIAACVGSLDSIPSKYCATVQIQMEHRGEAVARVEVIRNLKTMIVEHLKAFYGATRHKPEHIIFYRDGVSEGQFAEVRDMELRAIRDACLKLSPDGLYKPPITFIVVQKRHHTRFMPVSERDGVGKCRNIPPGTTVDTVVTHPVDFDFFLCSHAGIQGTSKPAHYYVVHDDHNFKADELQKLSYYLCHTYARCARSVSIPTPVYYAHLAAFRAKEHIMSGVPMGSSSGSVSSRGGDEGGATTEEYVKATMLKMDMKKVMYFV